MKYTQEGDTIIGQRLCYEGSKITTQVFRKSGSHRGQRGNIYNGESWIEVPIKLPEKKKQWLTLLILKLYKFKDILNNPFKIDSNFKYNNQIFSCQYYLKALFESA